jgi:CRP-like cAMP-binding protein
VTQHPPHRFAEGTFLARLGITERVALESLGVARHFPARTILMLQHEPSERVMILLCGRVKVSRTEPDGREVLLSIRDPGDVLGEIGFVDGEPRLATVTTLEPVQALVVSRQAFRAHLEKTPRVAVVLLEVVTSRFRETTVVRSQLALADTLGRVTARIVELCERYGDAQGAGTEMTMPISHDDLAAWAGASRTGTTQALQTLRELGWITTERRRLVVPSLKPLRERAH